MRLQGLHSFPLPWLLVAMCVACVVDVADDEHGGCCGLEEGDHFGSGARAWSHRGVCGDCPLGLSLRLTARVSLSSLGSSTKSLRPPRSWPPGYTHRKHPNQSARSPEQRSRSEDLTVYRALADHDHHSCLRHTELWPPQQQACSQDGLVAEPESPAQLLPTSAPDSPVSELTAAQEAEHSSGRVEQGA